MSKYIKDKKQLLSICGLKMSLSTGNEILKGVDLTINKGEIHVVMGPNGSGKSTMANSIMGNPVYVRTAGQIYLDGENISGDSVDVRAKKGMFMAFQSPQEVEGITTADFLKTAKAALTDKPLKFFSFQNKMQETMEELDFSVEYSRRYLNVGFSGGEKKKNEIFQMLMLHPRLAILDEIDSGLDVDAVRAVTHGIRKYQNEDNALLVISHSTRLLKDLDVDYVHILVDGRLVQTGDSSLIDEINNNGFARFSMGHTD